MIRRLSILFAAPIILVLCLLMEQAFAADAAMSAEETDPINAGQMMPEGNLYNPDGSAVSVSDLYSEKPVVLVYYRGDWCRYCNQHLRNLKNFEDELVDLGYQLIAVSADKPEILSRTKQEAELPYRLVSDSSMDMAKKLGIAFKVSDETIEKYKGYKIDLEEASGHDHHLLPIPAVFLIGTDGKILWTYSDPNYTERLNSEELVAKAKEYSSK
ncbi:MAG: AhpC/TSA family protein [Candidatus Omnitrophica bacterium]|nr:AhpC/TSA family protein [Candidatus Omnitrophota bacterium]MCA9430829.1 AhpC/TSA family protein [Candidatus Omnitrophota bacterium]MCA9435145.1 AhpC/TSA family protein [Candidatus Omnitrophota bacterium]MCB9768510.1 AhpC/TSA family protein [Candidatus Omnitrophota bacterium]